MPIAAPVAPDPAPSTDRLLRRAVELAAIEQARLDRRLQGCRRARHEAGAVMPLGVPANGQVFGSAPLVADHAAGARLWDLDGNEYIDLAMGYGALLTGHGHPAVTAAVTDQLTRGTLFVLPCDANRIVAAALGDRFAQPMWRFTTSGTETTMPALRLARAATGRDRLVKVQGGYHGQYDWMLTALGPPDGLDAEGRTSPASAGVPDEYLGLTTVVPFNDIDALGSVLARCDVAAFVVEPAIQNLSLILPDAGYLESARALCEQTGTLLVFDEVKIGITAGWSGATGAFGVRPDLVCVSKSIGGGLPIGAIGGRADLMAHLAPAAVSQVGTFSGNPLSMAAARATLLQACTPDATDRAIALSTHLATACQAVIDEHGLPAHTRQLGAKGCVTWAPAPLRHAGDIATVARPLALAQWLWGLNRGVLLPAALDSQWLVSVQHTETDVDHAADVFAAFAAALTG